MGKAPKPPKRGKKHIGAGRANPSSDRWFTPSGRPVAGNGGNSVLGLIKKVVFKDS